MPPLEIHPIGGHVGVNPIYVLAVAPTSVVLKVVPALNSESKTPHTPTNGSTRGVIVQANMTWISDPTTVVALTCGFKHKAQSDSTVHAV